MNVSRFRVTDTAGSRVAGRRVQPGDELAGTSELFRYEIDLRQLEPISDEAPADAPAPVEPEALVEAEPEAEPEAERG